MSTNVGALLRTLEVLHEQDRIRDIDAARMQAAISMASALDENPSNARLWQQYREAVKELTADDSNASVDDAIKDLFAQVGDSPPS